MEIRARIWARKVMLDFFWAQCAGALLLQSLEAATPLSIHPTKWRKVSLFQEKIVLSFTAYLPISTIHSSSVWHFSRVAK